MALFLILLGFTLASWFILRTLVQHIQHGTHLLLSDIRIFVLVLRSDLVSFGTLCSILCQGPTVITLVELSAVVASGLVVKVPFLTLLVTTTCAIIIITRWALLFFLRLTLTFC